MSATTDLGKVGITVNGTWSGSVAYEKNSIVNDGADSYISIQDVPIGTALNNTAYWTLLCNGFSSAEVVSAVNAWLVAHPEATTTVQDGVVTTAKLADGAVTDAKLAQSGGVLEDVADLKSSFNSCFDSEEVYPTNLLDRSAVTFGKYCTNTGAIAGNASYWYTDFIPVEEGETYTRQRGTLTVSGGRQLVSTRWISCYDNSKNVLADKGASDYPTSFTVPSGVAYLRFSDTSYMDDVSHPTIVKGTEIVDYSEYFEPYTSRVLKSECNNDEHINEIITERMHTTGIVHEFVINSDNHTFDDVQDVNNYTIEFKGIIDTFNGLIVGRGYNMYGGGYVKVTPTNFEYYLGTEASPRVSEPHGLTIKDYINIKIDALLTSVDADFTITTNGGIYHKTSVWDVRLGNLGVYSVGSNALTDCRLSYFVRGWNKDIHIFGDSYVGVYNDRWTYYLIQNEYTNYNLNAYSGRVSQAALENLKNVVLPHTIPKEIIWCMGMNDGDDGGSIDATWKACVDELMTICNENGIALVLATIPNVPSVDNTAKNAYVRASGYRYIDFASAVGASSGTTWYDGMLSSDNVHPAVQGAIALFNQAIADVPELMQ